MSVLILGAAGVAALALSQREEGVVVGRAPVPLKAPLAGVSVSLAGRLPAGKGTIGGAKFSALGKASAPRFANVYTAQSGGDRGTTALDQTIDQKAREAEKFIKEKFEKLSPELKKKGAIALSKALGLNPPLKGDESYKEITARVSAKLGEKACDAMGVGFAEKYCAIAGAYLGMKGYELAERAYGKIKDELDDAKDAVIGGVKDAADEVKDFIGGIF